MSSFTTKNGAQYARRFIQGKEIRKHSNNGIEESQGFQNLYYGKHEACNANECRIRTVEHQHATAVSTDLQYRYMMYSADKA